MLSDVIENERDVVSESVVSDVSLGGVEHDGSAPAPPVDGRHPGRQHLLHYVLVQVEVDPGRELERGRRQVDRVTPHNWP